MGIDKNPSFSLDEGGDKQIDEIKPEDIAKSVCGLLGLDFGYGFSTINIGKLFNNKTLESCMDSLIDNKAFNAPNIIARMDINFNLAILQQQLKICPCQIITNKEIPNQILKENRANILGIIYKIEKDNNPEFVSNLIKYKIGHQLISDLPENELNSIKLNYCDFGIISSVKKEIPEFLKNKDLDKIYYKSARVLLSKNKFYASYQDVINGRNFNPNSNDPLKLILNNIDLLWEDFNFCYFLEKSIDKI